MRHFLWIITLVWSWCSIGLQAQTIIYVSPTGSGLGNGTSWANAATIDDAIASASNNTELRLRGGIYPIVATLSVTQRLTIHGGYTGTGTDRNIEGNPSVLDGEYNVKIMRIRSSDVLLDGITFWHGYAATGEAYIGGGGLQVDGNNVTIRNCTFRDNRSENRIGSAALYLWSANNIVIDGCVFEGNRVEENISANGNIGGGAIHIRFGSNTRIQNTVFRNNYSFYDGGAVQDWGDNTLYEGCVFEGNESAGQGGGIYVRSDDTRIANCTFIGNRSTDGGGIASNFGRIEINASHFEGNQAQERGGAIYNHRFAVPSSIERTRFSENTAALGGAVYNFSEEGLKVISSLFVANEATDEGGAIFNNRFIEITNGTFVANSNTALVHSRFATSEYNRYHTTVYNSIFYQNTAKNSNYLADIAPTEGGTDASDKDVQRNIVQEFSEGINNQVVDPLFVNNADDFSLQTHSPAVNAGNNGLFDGISPTNASTSTDLANEPRLYGSAIDIGAYESQEEQEFLPQTITVADLTITYGESPFIHGESDSGLPLIYSSSNPAVAVIEDDEIRVIGAGTTTIVASQAGNATYLPAEDEDFELTVELAPLTIRALDDNRTYDGIPYDGGNGVTYEGFVYGETASVLDGTLTYGGSAQGATEVGEYAIVPQGLSSANYTISYEAGTLTIMGLNENVLVFNEQTAGSTVDVVYGDPVLDGGATASSGLAVSYSSSDITVATVNADGEVRIVGVGTTWITATQDGNADYNEAEPISFAVQVQPAQLIIRALDDNRTYDGIPYDGGNGITYEGFVYGETASVLDGTLTYGGSAQGATEVGEYTIVPQGLSSANYAINYEAGTLTIMGLNENVLVFNEQVAGSTVDVVYGDPILDGGATASSGLAVSYSSSDNTVATVNANGEVRIVGVGTTWITATQGGNADYNEAEPISFAVQVGPAQLIIRADPNNKTYGASDPLLTYAYDGLVSGDTQEIFTGSLSRTTGEEVGEYAILLGSLSAGDNYALNFVGETFTIAPAMITGLSFMNGRFVYDGTEHNLSISGTLPPDASVSYMNNGRTDVGVQTVTVTVSAPNYQTFVTTANLEVTPALLTVTANSHAKLYGSSDPELDYTVEGLVAQDVLSGSLSRDSGEAIGGYAILQGTLDAGGNYNLDFISGILTIYRGIDVVYVPNGPLEMYGSEQLTIHVELHNIWIQAFDHEDEVMLRLEVGDGLTVVGVESADMEVFQQNEVWMLRPYGIWHPLSIRNLEITLAGNGTFEGLSPLHVEVWNPENVHAQADTGIRLDIVVEQGEDELIIPNVFTPNGDGVNDVFTITGIRGYDYVKLVIVNQFGIEIYRNENYRNTWEARGIIDGTYYYVVQAYSGRAIQEYRGYVLIKRQ